MSYNNLGSIYNDEGDYDQALFYHQKALEKSMELGETGDLDQTNIAAVYANKGADLARKGKYAEAVVTYKEAIRRFDELHKPRYIKYQLTKGEHLDVIAAFEDFVARNPLDAEAYYCLACLYSAKGDDSKASEALDKAATLESSYRERANKFFVSKQTEQCTS
jgi:tetratricopeptide (TPR) repeat protein